MGSNQSREKISSDLLIDHMEQVAQSIQSVENAFSPRENELVTESYKLIRHIREEVSGTFEWAIDHIHRLSVRILELEQEVTPSEDDAEVIGGESLIWKES